MTGRKPIVVPEATAEQRAAADAARPATAEDAIAATAREYGQYVASQSIYVGTALGYNPGDAVGAAVVADRKWDTAGLVVAVGSPEHAALRERLGLPPVT